METLARVAEIRGEGMLCAVEFAADRETLEGFDPAETVVPRIVAAMAERGVIARAMPQGDILGLAPPLCLTEAEAGRIVEVAAEAVAFEWVGDSKHAQFKAVSQLVIARSEAMAGDA